MKMAERRRQMQYIIQQEMTLEIYWLREMDLSLSMDWDKIWFAMK